MNPLVAAKRCLACLALTLLASSVSSRGGALADTPSADLQHPVTRFSDPELIPETLVSPGYPESARKAGAGARFVFQVVIRRDGTVRDLTVVWKELLDAATCRPPEPASRFGGESGNRLLGEMESAAADAVLKWRYRPALQDGSPVEVIWTEGVRFCGEGATATPPPPPDAATPGPPAPRGDEDRQAKDITPPEILPGSWSPPRFPERGRTRGVGARVVLEVKVSAEGEPRDYQVLAVRALDPMSCLPGTGGGWERKLHYPPDAAPQFEQEAWTAVSRWSFRPALLKGLPVEGRARVSVDFCVDRKARWLL